ncbi:hypothetical protein REPUB_Repub01dG0258800 [Reevesia pubescens]
MFGAATLVFDEMIANFVANMDVLDAFSEGFKDFESNPNLVFRFLLESSCQKGMVNMSFYVFVKMSKWGVYVSHHLGYRILDSLVNANRFDIIVDNYGNLCRFFRTRGLCVYGIVMEGFLKKGEVEKALDFRKGMIERGLGVDIVAYNKIFKSLSANKEIGIASKLFDIILLLGPLPNVVTFSTLINMYCKDGKLDKAFELYNIMILRNLLPDVIMYAILIDGYFKAGRLDEMRERSFSLGH